MAIGHYELKKAKNGQYHFNLKASNGEIILASEMYASKASAENGIARCKPTRRTRRNMN